MVEPDPMPHGGGGGEHEHDEHEERGVANAAMFVCITLMVGLLCRNILPGILPFPAPYTVLLLVLGVLLGTLNQFLPKEGMQLYAINEEWANVDPHVILIVFLPTLIFESAFSVDFHVFRKSFWQIFALAFPGMVIGTVLTAVVTNNLFHYDWAFSSHLMLGSILAATDPVAVVALLKELGAAKPLETLIEGESLLNDGTAIVAFSIFRGVVAETINTSPGAVVGLGLQLATVGPLMGAAFAGICTYVLGYIYNDAISEVTMTVISCYTAFAAAEGTDLHTSGVLAVVTLGVLMSGYAKTRVSPEVEHTMHSFWELLGYVANTVIFLLAGLIIAEKALFSSYVGAAEFGYLLVLYVALHAVRAACILVCYPVLLWSGYPMDWRSAVVLSYAGLRGAVGLSLGLIVEQDESINETLRERVLFYVAGIAFLTLLINGSTTKLLLNQLGLGKETPVQRRMFEHACDLLNSAAGDSAQALTSRPEFALADWNAVWSYMPVYTKHAYDDRKAKGRVPGTGGSQAPARLVARWDRYRARFDEIDDNAGGKVSHSIFGIFSGCQGGTQRQPASSPLVVGAGSAEVQVRRSGTPNQGAAARDEIAVRAETRRRFIAASRGAYWHRHEAGLLGRDALRLLLLAESEQLDQADHDAMRQWEALEGLIELPRWLLLARQVPQLHCITDPLIRGYVATAYDVAVGFSHGQAAVRRAKESWSVSPEAGGRIAEESKAQQVQAEDWAERLQSGFPAVCRSIQTQQAALALLSKERHLAMRLHQEGGIDEKQLELILHHNNTSCKKAEGHPSAVQPKTLAELLGTSALAGRALPAESLAAVLAQAQTLTLRTNKFIFKQNEAANDVVVVLEGSVAVFASTTSGAAVRGFDTRDLAKVRSSSGVSSRVSSPVPPPESPMATGLRGRGVHLSRKASFRVQTRTEKVFARRVGPGSIVGAAEALLGTKHSTSAVAATSVTAARIPTASLRELMRESTGFSLAAWRSAAAHVAHVFLDSFAGCDRADIEAAMAQATVVVPWGQDDTQVSTDEKTKASGSSDPLVVALLPPESAQVPVLAAGAVDVAMQGEAPTIAALTEGVGRQFLGASRPSHQEWGDHVDRAAGGRESRLVGQGEKQVTNPLSASPELEHTAVLQDSKESATKAEPLSAGGAALAMGLTGQGDSGPTLQTRVPPAGRTVGYGKQGWLLLREDTCVLMRGCLLRAGSHAVRVPAFHTIRPGEQPLRFSKGSLLVRIPGAAMATMARAGRVRAAAGSVLQAGSTPVQDEMGQEDVAKGGYGAGGEAKAGVGLGMGIGHVDSVGILRLRSAAELGGESPVCELEQAEEGNIQ